MLHGAKIKRLKIEFLFVFTGLTEASDSASPDSREDQLKQEIEDEKAKYRNIYRVSIHLVQFLSYSFKLLYGRLKDMKTEIEHVQHLLEKAKVQLQKDFDVWWKQQANQVRPQFFSPENL